MTTTLRAIASALLFATVAHAEALPSTTTQSTGDSQTTLQVGTYWVRRLSGRGLYNLGAIDPAESRRGRVHTTCSPVSVMEFPSSLGESYWTLRLWEVPQRPNSRGTVPVDLLMADHRQPQELTGATFPLPRTDAGLTAQCRDAFMFRKPVPEIGARRTNLGKLHASRADCGVDADVEVTCDRAGHCVSVAPSLDLFSLPSCEAAIRQLLTVDGVLNRAAAAEEAAAKQRFAQMIARGGVMWEQEAAATSCTRIDVRTKSPTETTLARTTHDVVRDKVAHRDESFRFDLERQHSRRLGWVEWSEPRETSVILKSGLGVPGNAGELPRPLRFGAGAVAIDARLLFFEKGACEPSKDSTP